VPSHQYVLSAQNKPEESLQVLAEIRPASPYYPSARLRSAINLDTLDRTDEAIAQLTAIAAEQPEAIAAEVQLGDILRNKKRYAEAVTAYDEAIRRSATAGLPERWSLFYDRGVALERSGQWQHAEQDLKHALELKPEQPLVLNYLGYSWIDRGENLDQGVKMIEKAVELRPEDGYIVDSLGWAHYRMGDYAGAVEYLEKAIELVPQDPMSRQPATWSRRSTHWLRIWVDRTGPRKSSSGHIIHTCGTPVQPRWRSVAS
jgi:tetratricopeptide (TPR) repeat protein